MMQITYHPLGDCALLIQWDQRIDPKINAQVVQLNQAIKRAQLTAIRYCIPAYCSLTIAYNPKLITYSALCQKIQTLVNTNQQQHQSSENRCISIPVCYEDSLGPDLKSLSTNLGLSVEQIIKIHTSTRFRVYMLGFLPGFPYLGILPKILSTSRKKVPRLYVPAGSVALAGLQTGIYPQPSPGGWQIIGRTPLQIFDPERAEPFYLQAGDEVQFEAISLNQFEHWK